MGGRFDGTVTPVNSPPQDAAGLWWAPEIRRYRFTRAPPRVFSRRVGQAPQKRTSWLDTDNLLRIRPLPANNLPRRPFRLVGEHYSRERPLSHNAARLPRKVMWYADPSGAGDISELRHAGFTVRRGTIPSVPASPPSPPASRPAGSRFWRARLPRRRSPRRANQTPGSATTTKNSGRPSIDLKSIKPRMKHR
jgi:hypothetical protein